MSMFNKPKFRKPGFKLALVATALSAVVIILGVYTRLVAVGFGCSDWSSCYGAVNAEFVVWPVLSHRYLAGILGALITVLAVGSWRRRDDVVGMQILLGGWTSANYAAFACPDFPLCQNQWWPEMDFWQGFNIAQTFGVDTLSETLESKARVAIHVIHRLGAVVTTVYLLGLAILLLTINHRRIRRMSLILVAVLSVQLLLVVGSGQVRATLLTAIVHNIGSVLLLLTLVTLATRVWTAKLKYQRLES